MAQTDLSEITSEIIRKALFETIENKLNSKNYEIDLSLASKAGENNFIGIIYRVAFYEKEESSKEGEKVENAEDRNVGEKVNNDEKCSLSKLILKVAPQNEARRAQFYASPAFAREIYTYDKILPFFKQFEESKGLIINENGFTEYPECYRTIDQEPFESLFLEDLSIKGFTIIDRRTEDVTADHVRLVMQTLGKLHAISFALKDQQPDKFNELASQLNEVFVRKEDDHLRYFFNKQSEAVFNSVSNEGDEHLLDRVKLFYKNDALDVAADCLSLELTGGASVISHGDCWQNNTMFRYDNDGKPIEISFLDWQTTRHASPIIDIVYYMFCCTTKELRDDNYDNFLKVYHDSLSGNMRRLGSDPEKLFPFQMMLDHFRKFAKFGLILSTVLLPMMTSESGNGIDLDEIAEDLTNGKEVNENIFISESSMKKFNKRLHDVVADMVRLEYI